MAVSRPRKTSSKAFQTRSKTTRPAGDTVAHAYDPVGRLTKTDFSLAATTDIGIAYDSSLGNATKITGPATELQYKYEGSRMTKETYVATGDSMEFGYNGAGLRSSMKTPGSYGEYAYIYDSKGRLTCVYNPSTAGSTVAAMLYDSDSNRLTARESFEAWTGAKILRAGYQYDATGRLTRVENVGYLNGSPEDGGSISYEFNDVGNVTRAWLYDDENQWLAYQYDALDRLTREERSGTDFDYLNEYWYDAGGNRTKLAYTHGGSTATTTYLYDDNYRLTKSAKDGTDTAYDWDAAGNLTKKATASGDTWEYLWDARDKLTKVRKQPNGQSMADVATYAYDPQGRRFQKTVYGVFTTTYYQDGLTPVVQTGGVEAGVNRSVPGALGNVIDTDGIFYAYDRLGNVLGTYELVDEDEDEVWDYGVYTPCVMDAFGNVLQGDQAGFHLTTKQYDADVELYYFNARWYEAQTGRFVSAAPHPAEFEHPYSFCNNSPLASSDVTGAWIRPAIFIARMLILCGLGIWLAFTVADCIHACEVADQTLENNRDRLGEALYCKFLAESAGCTTGCLSDAFGAGGVAVGCILAVVLPTGLKKKCPCKDGE